jgi:hypothetical protein
VMQTHPQLAERGVLVALAPRRRKSLHDAGPASASGPTTRTAAQACTCNGKSSSPRRVDRRIRLLAGHTPQRGIRPQRTRSFSVERYGFDEAYAWRCRRERSSSPRLRAMSR